MAKVDVTGVCTIDPGVVTSEEAATPSLSPFLNLGVRRDYDEYVAGGMRLSAVTDSPLPLGSVTRVNFLVLRVRSGSLTAKLTSPSGVEQIVPVADLLVLSDPPTTSGLSAILLTGTADVEYIVAGE